MDPMFRSSQDSSLLLQTTESAKSMISTLLKARSGGSGSGGNISTMSEGLLFASQPPNLIERYSSLSSAAAASSSSCGSPPLPTLDLLSRNGATLLLLGEKLKKSASSNCCTSGLTDVLSFTSKDSVFGFGFPSSKKSAPVISSGSGDVTALLPQQKQSLINKPPPVAASRKKMDWYGDYYAQLPGRGDEEGNRDNGGCSRKNGACERKPLFGRPAAKALIESNNNLHPVNGSRYNAEPPPCEQQAARNLVSLVNGSNFPAPRQVLHHHVAQHHRQGLSFGGENSHFPVHHQGRETSKQGTMRQLAANAPWLAHGITTSATASHVRAYCGPMSTPVPYPANSPLFEPATSATATTYSRVATAVLQEANEVVATGEGGGNVVLLCQIKHPSVEVKGFVTPTDLDVIIGRGGKANNHPGNKRYLKLKDEIQKQERYIRASKQEKTVIAQEVVDVVRGWGGRFLKLDEGTEQWHEVENTIARRKASQALREINTAEQRAAKSERDRAARLAKVKRVLVLPSAKKQQRASSTKIQTPRTLHC